MLLLLNPWNLQHWTVREVATGGTYSLMLESHRVQGMPWAGVKFTGRVSNDVTTYLTRVRSHDSAPLQALTAIERKGVLVKHWRGQLRLGEVWGLVKVRKKRKRSLWVEFVNIWPMLNFQGVGHVTLNFLHIPFLISTKLDNRQHLGLTLTLHPSFISIIQIHRYLFCSQMFFTLY